jgi:3-oxoacyl-[acyl-carrier-protein] synthase III
MIIKLDGVSLDGIACSVPANAVSNEDSPFAESKKISKNIGVYNRVVSSRKTCTSDLCFSSAECLLSEMSVARDEIEALVFISQTPDYVLPATSCVLQHRLGLSTNTPVFDVNLGCSGYVYGLWLAANLLIASRFKNVLLLVGDTSTKLIDPLDRTTAMLFGDAGSATFLRQTSTDSSMSFVLGTDGSGFENLIVKGGGFREHDLLDDGTAAPESPTRTLYMDGAEIFSFTLNRVVPLINELMEHARTLGIPIDYYVLHQANEFLLNHLRTRLKVPSGSFPIAMGQTGNTSSASIPLALSSSLRETMSKSNLNLLLAGFGVGYSWAGALIRTSNVVMPSIQRI